MILGQVVSGIGFACAKVLRLKGTGVFKRQTKTRVAAEGGKGDCVENG